MTPDEILAKAKAARKPLPRWVWIASLVVGAACAGAFAWTLIAPAGTPSTPGAQPAGSPGFASGMLVGAVVGFLVGWAARQRASSRSSP